MEDTTKSETGEKHGVSALFYILAALIKQTTTLFHDLPFCNFQGYCTLNVSQK